MPYQTPYPAHLLLSEWPPLPDLVRNCSMEPRTNFQMLIFVSMLEKVKLNVTIIIEIQKWTLFFPSIFKFSSMCLAS